MAVPVLETGWTTHSSVSDDATVSLGKPTGLVAGDTILVIAASEQSNNNYMAEITSPDVYQRIDSPNNRQDVQLGIYLREATGTETWPLVFECSNLDFYTNVAVCIRITGACTTAPHRVGSWVGVGSTGTGLTIPEVTTAVNDCLGVWVGATDGSDVSPFSVTSGTGWSRTGGLENPTNSSNGIGLDFGEKDHSTAGVSADIVLDMSGSGTDGRIGIQLMFAPDTEFTDPVHGDPTEVISFLDETPGASSQATGSGTYVAGEAYVAVVTSYLSSGSVATTLTGWSNTWTDVSDTLGMTQSLWSTATDRRVQVFEIQGQCVGSGSGALTVAYTTQPSHVSVQVIRIPNGADIVAMSDGTGTLGTTTDLPYGPTFHAGIIGMADPGSRLIGVHAGNANRASTIAVADPASQHTVASVGKAGCGSSSGTILGWSTSPTGYAVVSWTDVSGAFEPTLAITNNTGGSASAYNLAIEVGVLPSSAEVTGTINSAWGGWSATSSGLHEVPATVNTAWGGWTATAVGDHEIPATVNTVWGGLTATASGLVDHPATVNSGWSGWTATASGLVDHLATVNSGWSGWTATSTGLHEVPATISSSWGGWSASSTGLVDHLATISTVWGGWVAAASGTVSIVATISTDWSGWTATGTASVDHPATILTEWGGWVGTAVGSVSLPGVILTDWGSWVGVAFARQLKTQPGGVRLLIVGPPPVRRALFSVKTQLDDMRSRIEALEP